MRLRLGVLMVVVVLVATVLGGWLGDRVTAGGPADGDVDRLLKTFTEAFAAVRQNYAKEEKSDELIENAIRGMLRTLDPHSSYFEASDYRQITEEQSGKYYGLGILIRPERPDSGRVIVVEPPSPGTPGYKVGLRPGDIITHINGQSIEEWEYPDEIIPKLKGPKGTTVRITVERQGENPFELEVERDAIPLYTIKFAFHVKPNIGYIRIDRFSETTIDELNEALDKLDEPNLEGLILDLRNNPGGALTQAIAVSDRFLQSGQVIVSTRNRQGDQREYRAPHGNQYRYPMVVLINRYSASASEIVSGALQDHDRALILGETSFGKALVQTVYPLRGNRGLALTTGRYYTPSNRLIQRPYSEGFYDYYNNTRGEEANAAASDAYKTDGGRKVFSGGGITPDVEEQIDHYTTLSVIANRKNLFYEFAGKLTSGEIKTDIPFRHDLEEIRGMSEGDRNALMDKLTVSEQTLALFKDFLVANDVGFTDEQFDESRIQLANRIRQEVFIRLFGERDGHRIQIEIDNQVQKAIELLPKAQALLTTAKRNTTSSQ